MRGAERCDSERRSESARFDGVAKMGPSTT